MKMSKFQSERLSLARTWRATRNKAISNTTVTLLSSVFGLISMCGCTTTTAYLDQNVARRETLSYYNAEVMENLIRASQGLLFVHVDLTNLQATVTTNYAATLSGGQSLLNTSTNGTTTTGKLVTGVICFRAI